jgi:hypothetical protein
LNVLSCRRRSVRAFSLFARRASVARVFRNAVFRNAVFRNAVFRNAVFRNAAVSLRCTAGFLLPIFGIAEAWR